MTRDQRASLVARLRELAQSLEQAERVAVRLRASEPTLFSFRAAIREVEHARRNAVSELLDDARAIVGRSYWKN